MIAGFWCLNQGFEILHIEDPDTNPSENFEQFLSQDQISDTEKENIILLKH